MLNEERVKRMVKLALYETQGGREELRISSYFKKDYISMNVLSSVIWLTLAYIVALALFGISFMDILMENLTLQLLITIVASSIVLYIVLLITYIVVAGKVYRKRHARAYHRVKKFKQGLEQLENMYKKEDGDAETIRD